MRTGKLRQISSSDSSSQYFSSHSICLPVRDWEPGERAVDQLSDSIRESERVMAVITDSFISDPWCVLQFTLAMRERLTQPVSGLIGETEGSKGKLDLQLNVTSLQSIPILILTFEY